MDWCGGWNLNEGRVLEVAVQLRAIMVTGNKKDFRGGARRGVW